MMTHKLTVELSDDVYRPFAEAARRVGHTPEEHLASSARQASRLRQKESTPADRKGLDELLKFAGCISYSEDGADNDKIDADLAREYADDHEEKN